MVEFIRRNRILLTSGCLLLASLLLFSTSTGSRPYRDPVAEVLLEALAPFQVAFTWLRTGVRDVWTRYIEIVETHRENQRLHERIALLDSEIVRMAELEQSNRRLSDLLRFRTRMEGLIYGARVIARDPLPWSRTLTIDRGARDGIRRGMAVLSPHGVVGQIAEVSGSAGRVLLLTDSNSGIDAIVQRSRARGIVQGGREGRCSMNYLRRDDDVARGDRVLTSGLDGIFPKGIMIGEVVDVTRRHRGLLQGAIVEPSVPLDRLEEVLVVDPTAQIKEPPW